MPSEYELIDRIDEISLLMEHWNSVKNGNGKFIMVNGEAGIGKTQLVEIFLKNIKNKFTYLHGECVDTRVIPYLPFIMAVSNYLDNIERNKLKRIKKVLIENAELILNILPVIGNISPIIAKILRDIDNSELWKISEFDEMGELVLIRKWIKLIEDFCKNQPMIIFLDDIHWADSATLNLIRDLSKRINNKPILLICTYRTEYINEYSFNDTFNKIISNMRIKHLFEKIELKRIKKYRIPDIIRCFLGEVEMTKDQYDFIYMKTEGNPFSIRELLSYLVEEEYLEKKHGKWVFSKSDKEIVVPTTIKEMVLKRISSLPDEFRELLEFASVIGLEFRSKELNAVFNYDERTLLNHLRKIEQIYHLIKDMIDKHRFYHINIRDVLYDQLPPQLCQLYHRTIAEYFEKNIKDDSVVFVLAYHYLHAREWIKALHYSIEAGDKAKSVFSYHDAEEYYERSIDIINKEFISHEMTIEKLQKIYFNLGFIKRYLGDFMSAKTLFEICIEYLKDTDEVIPLAMNYTFMADVLQHQGKYWESKNLLYSAVEIFERNIEFLSNEQIRLYGYALNRLGIYYKRTDYIQKAKMLFEKSKELGHRTKSDSLIASSYANLGAIEKNFGNYDKTLEYWKKSLEIARDSSDYYRIAHYLLDLGYLYLLRREYKLAEEYIINGKEIAVKGEFWEEICRAYLTEGNLYFIIRQNEKALKLYKKAEETAKEYNIRRLLWQIMNNIGNCYFDDFDEAHEYYRESVDILVEMVNELGTKEEKEGFVRHNIGPFKSMITLCVHFNDLEEAERIAKLSELNDLNEFYKDLETHRTRDFDRNYNFHGFYVMMG